MASIICRQCIDTVTKLYSVFNDRCVVSACHHVCESFTELARARVSMCVFACCK